MPKCELFEIEQPIGKKCPHPANISESLCYHGCGFAENWEIYMEIQK